MIFIFNQPSVRIRVFLRCVIKSRSVHEQVDPYLSDFIGRDCHLHQSNQYKEDLAESVPMNTVLGAFYLLKDGY